MYPAKELEEVCGWGRTLKSPVMTPETTRVSKWTHREIRGLLRTWTNKMPGGKSKPTRFTADLDMQDEGGSKGFISPLAQTSG